MDIGQNIMASGWRDELVAGRDISIADCCYAFLFSEQGTISKFEDENV
jgi:hypothetical protein